MAGKTVAVIVTIAFSLLGVPGDYFLKVASADERRLRIGWLFVMKHLKLGTIGVLLVRFT